MSTQQRAGYVMDMGAQFLSSGYSVIGGLIDELGLAPYSCRASRWTGIVRDGVVRRIHAGLPWTLATSGLLRWRDVIQVARASSRLIWATRRLPLNDYSQWHGLDTADAAESIEASFGPEALEYVFEPILEGFYFQTPERMSYAWPAMVWNFGARQKRVFALTGGLGRLPEALAKKVKISLATPAEAIDVGGPGVQVRTATGTLQADFVVLAATAPAARRLYAAEHEVERRLLNTDYSAAMNISFAFPDGVSTAKVDEDIYGLLIPRKERRVIAAIGIESRKRARHVPEGELLNVMLDGSASARLLQASEEQVLAEVVPELERYFPGADGGFAFAHFSRWPHAEPLSLVGRSRDLEQYRRLWNPNMKVILAGDYMGIPCAEGAAESGDWAAAALTGKTGTRQKRPNEALQPTAVTHT